MKRSFIVFMLVLAASPAISAPKYETCSGKLTKLEGGYWVLSSPPEEICTFANEAIRKKVLATCVKGQVCEVTGEMGDCENTECAEVRSVKSVRRVVIKTRAE